MKVMIFFLIFKFVFCVKFTNKIIIITILGVTMPAFKDSQDSCAMDISLVEISESAIHSNPSMNDEPRNEGNYKFVECCFIIYQILFLVISEGVSLCPSK